jgi:hypothetical protein
MADAPEPLLLWRHRNAFKVKDTSRECAPLQRASGEEERYA